LVSSTLTGHRPGSPTQLFVIKANFPNGQARAVDPKIGILKGEFNGKQNTKWRAWHVPIFLTDKMTFPPRESQLMWYQRFVYIVLNFFFSGPANGPFYAINTKRNHFLSLYHAGLSETGYITFMKASGFDYMPAMNSYDKYIKGVRRARRLVLFFIVTLLLTFRMFFLPAYTSTHCGSDDVEYRSIRRLSPQSPSCLSLPTIWH
jgi:hypothetical protein